MRNGCFNRIHDKTLYMTKKLLFCKYFVILFNVLLPLWLTTTVRRFFLVFDFCTIPRIDLRPCAIKDLTFWLFTWLSCFPPSSVFNVFLSNLVIKTAYDCWLCQHSHLVLSNSYTMVCPPVRGDNPRASASGLSPAQADKLWYNYLLPPLSV